MRVKVWVATDLDEEFMYPQTFRVKSTKTTDKFIELNYKLPQPLICNWVKFKVEFLGDTDTNILATKRITLRRIGAVMEPTAPVSKKTNNKADDGAGS